VMDLVFSSTRELAAAIRDRKISAVEALDAHLAEIDRHNEAVNAVVTLDREGARARAKKADEAQARGDALGPLHGVPFTLKDTHETLG
ncbi:amidase family protein, partial [Mesorhizobium sp.]|uniref:amidase family protein n=1 Tax=Mesorhizobium sp. TaxID=1871066 RepID=UPI0025D771A2